MRVGILCGFGLWLWCVLCLFLSYLVDPWADNTLQFAIAIMGCVLFPAYLIIGGMIGRATYHY